MPMSAKILRLAAFVMVAYAALGAAPARAAMIEYYTRGAFDGSPAAPGTSPTSLTVGTGLNAMTVTFNGVGTVLTPYEVLAIPTTNDSLGSFTVTGAASSAQLLTGHTFTLYITQVVPTPNSPYTPFTSTLTGTIQFRNSQAFVVFNNPTTQIINSVTGQSPSAVTYTVDTSTKLVAPNQLGPGVVSLEGTITAAPEPSTMVLAIAGLPLAGLAAWRRKRRIAA